MAVERALDRLPAAARRRVAWRDNERALNVLMIGPAILYIVLLVAVPFFLALYYSVSGVTLGNRQLNFVGLRNFAAVLGTVQFDTALKNTFVFAIISQIIVGILATALGLALERDFRGKSVVRFLILLPWVAPISLGTIAWLWMLDSIYSVVNWTLRAIGVFGPNTWPMWLGVPHLAMASVIMVHVWRQLPLATIILLAGLASIPREIHDAAQVDGARFWRHLLEITLPLLTPIMTIAILFGIVFTFTDMIVIYVLTRGGPYDTTQVLASLAFFTGVNAGDLGQGAAISIFLFPVLVAAAALFLRFARRAEVT
ncbi:MAG TPA: sugar ABC transporter permease [Methylomirabilota bacterium]|nr:sugar ABC transporter permease [Methylomirabilota bacterium]